VRIERFDDGGVTVTWPAPRRLKITWWKELISWAVVLCILAGGLRAAGMPLRAMPSHAARLAALWVQAPPLYRLLLAIPLACGVVPVALRLRQRGPTVVGISAREVYFDVHGLIFRTRARVPRARLRGIRVVRWTRTLTQRPRCIQLLLSDRAGVSVGDDRPPREIVRVAKILQEAMRARSDTEQVG
jgi:hypothetical protein